MYEYKNFFDTKNFLSAKKLTGRTDIAEAFNLQGRIAVELKLNVDEYGDVGTKFKVEVRPNHFETVEVRRYSDSDEIELCGKSYTVLSADFGLCKVEELYEKSNRVTIKDGDKVVILVIEEEKERAAVLTGTVQLPKWSVGTIFEGKIILDKAC